MMIRERYRKLMVRTKGFTLTEVIISVFIISIVGGASAIALHLFLGTFHQIDDYAEAEAEINRAVQMISREFALIGLGMPNNTEGSGSFARTFRPLPAPGANDPWPIMAFMGGPTADPDVWWGGPVTVTNSNPTNWYPTLNTHTLDVAPRGTAAFFGAPPGTFGPPINDDPPPAPPREQRAYVGPELYYAWGIPTGVMARFEADRSTVNNDGHVRIRALFFEGDQNNGGIHLNNILFDGRRVGLLTAPASRSARSWLLFPTLRLPLLLYQWQNVGVGNPNIITTRAAPGAFQVTGDVMGLDEVHLVQAARLFLDANNQLIRVTFEDDYTTNAGRVYDVLARNIVGLQFVFNPESRLLTMFIAARGREPVQAGSGRIRPHNWPAWLPQQIDPTDPNAPRFRIATRALTWRLRN